MDEMTTRLQFRKVLGEMERSNFRDVLVHIALNNQRLKASRLGFGRVFKEMEARGYTQVLQEVAVLRREKKTADIAKRLRLLQLEAKAAGISLEALDWNK